jgi:hypothetical protein
MAFGLTKAFFFFLLLGQNKELLPLLLTQLSSPFVTSVPLFRETVEE